MTELRAFSDDSDDPIVLPLSAADGRAFGLAVADVLTALDAGVRPLPQTELTIAGRRVVIMGTEELGLKLDVERPAR
ncbi:hypothetical protein [Solirubrobacter soli]|uniref:hypothetical protein n=1 Tax=Solirubrobacter soli TaxID=363832 RepID=UPI0003FAE6A9|nr:hypothetical protein [Solirubrobacter soli]